MTAQFFNSRGIGSDYVPADFVTGEPIDGLAANISGFVRSKEAGEKIVEMFKGRARLDYREREPNWIQVKVGVRTENVGALHLLHNLTRTAHDFITPALVDAVIDLATTEESAIHCNRGEGQ